MSDPNFGKEEYIPVNAIVTQSTAPLPEDFTYVDNLKIANYLNSNIKDGKIIVDDFVAFPIIYLSGNTSLFVETIDADFQPRLKKLKTDPEIKYILVRKHNDIGRLDAINRMYPTMFVSGAGMATLVEDFGTWRLYKKI